MIFEQVGPLDPLDVVGQAQRLTDFFDSGFNVAPTAQLPAGGALKIAVGPGAGVHFVNPA